MKPTLVLHAAELRKHARKIADAIARQHAHGCCVIAKPAPNPTLVAHGLVKASRWHILTHDPPRRAVADLYVGSQAEAARITRLLANLLSRGGNAVTLELLDNTATPKDLRAHPRSFIDAGPGVPSLNPTRSKSGQFRRAHYRKHSSRKIRRAQGAVLRRAKSMSGPKASRISPAKSLAKARHYRQSHERRLRDFRAFGGVTNPSRSKAAKAKRAHIRRTARRRQRRAVAGGRSSAMAQHYAMEGTLRGVARRTAQRRAAGLSAPNPKGRISIDQSILSPSGRVSKRSRAAAMKRVAADLFPPGFWSKAPATTKAEANRLLHAANELRALAARGMSPRKHVKEAQRLELLALELGRAPNPKRRKLKGGSNARTSLRRGHAARRHHHGTGSRSAVGTAHRRGTGVGAVRAQVGTANPKGRVDQPWRLTFDEWWATRRSGPHALELFEAAKIWEDSVTKAIASPTTSAQVPQRVRSVYAKFRDPGHPRGRRNPVDDDPKQFSVGDVVSISAMPYFGKHGTVTAIGKTLVTVNVHFVGKRKFRAGDLRLANPKGRVTTIYEALVQRLQRTPTAAELKAEVKRIIHEGTVAGRKRNPKGLKIGDRVRYSIEKIEQFRRSHSGFNYLKSDPKRQRADELMQDLLDQRGVITEVSLNGYRIRWEPSAQYPNGITSSTIDYHITSENDPLLKGTGRTRNPKRRVSHRKKGGVRRVTTTWRSRSRARVSSPAPRRRPNPASSSAAAKVTRMFQDRGPIRVKTKRMKAPAALKGAVAKIGDLVAVVYRSNKFDGKHKDYEHEFKSPTPVLVADPSSGDLNLVRGKSRYGLTPDGIIN